MFLLAYVSISTLVLLILSIYVVHKYISRKFKYWEKRNVFYFQPSPFWGNFLDIMLFRTTIAEFLHDLYNRTSEPFFGIFVFDTPHLVVRSPEIIRSILVQDFNYFDDRTIASPDHDPVLSNALFLSKNPDWKRIRTKITPVYTTQKLKGMIPLINEVGEIMAGYLEKNISNTHMEAKEICAKFSTDVIAKCAFGINAHCFDTDDDSEFRKMGKLVFDFRLSKAIRQTSYFFLPNLVRIFRLKFVDSCAVDFMVNAFTETIKRREETGETRNDVIDSIVQLKKQGEFSSDSNKITSQAVQFFLAGFETTASTIAFALYELCLHPQIQTKLRNEIKSTLQKYGEFTYDAIQDMKYLDMCVSETLRKYPALPFLDRRCKSDYKIPGTDVVIEKGTPIYIPMFGLHYDEEYFPHPHKFNPERFSDANASQITPFSYLPFGEGPRHCIGARFGLIGTKLGLAHILTKFEVEKSSNTPVPLEFEPRSFVLASKIGLPMKFRKHFIHAG